MNKGEQVITNSPQVTLMLKQVNDFQYKISINREVYFGND